jgi:hypothetical protein
MEERRKKRGELMLSICGRARKWREPCSLGSDSPTLFVNRITHLASLFNYVSMRYSFALHLSLIENNNPFV